MIFLLVAAAVVVAAPLVAAVLVTVASLHEDSARSLTGRPPGLLAAAARRVLCLRTSVGAGPRRPAGLAPTDQVHLSHAYSDMPLPSSDEGGHTLTLPRS